MKCQHCGEELIGKFCTKCGQPASADRQSAKENLLLCDRPMQDKNEPVFSAPAYCYGQPATKKSGRMFENIGNKIKILAKVICWGGIIGSIIAAVSRFAEAVDYNETLNITLGIVFLIVGSLLSWIGSFFMYGFGELIEKTTEISNKLSQNSKSKPKTLDELLKAGLITIDEYIAISENEK